MSGAWVALFVILWLVVVLLIVLVTGLIRRISALETQQAAAPVRRRSGLKVGSPPPTVRGYERLAHVDGSVRGRIVVFLSSMSQAEARLARELREHLNHQTGMFDVELAYVLSAFDDAAATDLRTAAFAVQDGGELASAWNIPGTPFAVVLDRDGTVRTATFVHDATDVLSLARLPSEAAEMSGHAHGR